LGFNNLCPKGGPPGTIERIARRGHPLAGVYASGALRHGLLGVSGGWLPGWSDDLRKCLTNEWRRQWGGEQ